MHQPITLGSSTFESHDMLAAIILPMKENSGHYYFIASVLVWFLFETNRLPFNKGSNFGEIAMIDSKERTTSVLALTM